MWLTFKGTNVIIFDDILSEAIAIDELSKKHNNYVQ